MSIERSLVKEIICRALREDVGTGDITTASIVSENYVTIGFIRAKEPGVAAGLEVAGEVFKQLNPEISFQPRVRDGDMVTAGQLLARVEGDARAILTGERVALNFLQRMSGIATRTAHLAGIIAGEKAKLTDTRKTTPGLRLLEKYAVRVGGGYNHRFGLYDAILIKDNHIKVAGSITEAISRAKSRAPHIMGIEVEVESLEGLEEAIRAGADIVMLDNMDLEAIKEAVSIAGGRVLLEASGQVHEGTILSIARTGVNLISVGGITHSARSLDISLDVGEMKPIAGVIL
ncbi:MAG: nicotinate-nucleotide pyrophosphorylase [Peptococcaceae bacterium BICA1-7]|nr:MAG: nicotinate-nucleotide pyrophosphorylase [Peptococcaceae bacterium BICA1-7]HBV96194.1 carboxylating nicotinate-nucleotide diphosphorylase [Desulfotomaculum sp.]